MKNNTEIVFHLTSYRLKMKVRSATLHKKDISGLGVGYAIYPTHCEFSIPSPWALCGSVG